MEEFTSISKLATVKKNKKCFSLSKTHVLGTRCLVCVRVSGLNNDVLCGTGTVHETV